MLLESRSKMTYEQKEVFSQIHGHLYKLSEEDRLEVLYVALGNCIICCQNPQENMK